MRQGHARRQNDQVRFEKSGLQVRTELGPKIRAGVFLRRRFQNRRVVLQPRALLVNVNANHVRAELDRETRGRAAGLAASAEMGRGNTG